ncbi:hypothetical protein ACJJIW_18450 [Microbulbifer sp. JMSA004]|uniref:hypothetical protein n=1 Tax=unclassified Microbulbifer TaxID=2619833 RepID=UPI0024AD6342|nr:hypothetical protein [Microbulbifer sp. VAAF005]WHI46985.1 hypothetical protein P0078_01015 [Microbulbifer sp. VAAF005]
MDLIISILGHALTAIAALIAIYGKTWDESRVGIKRITRVGGVAAGVAVVGLALSVFQTVDKYQEKAAYKNHALSKIEKGWSNLFVPFEALHYQVTGMKPKRGEHLEFAELVLKKNLLTSFDRVDFKEVHRFPKFGTVGNMVCSQTLSGMGVVTKYVDEYSDHLDLKIKAAVEELQLMPAFSTLIRFGGCPGIRGRSINDPDRYQGQFDTPQMRAYIRKLIDFQKLIT